MISMVDEFTYVNRLKVGDTDAFNHLYAVWSGKLYGFMMRISDGNIYMSEEMVQIVFVKVWERRDLLDPKKSFGAYLCTIAKNQLINIYQHQMHEFLYQEKIAHNMITSDNDTEETVDYHFLEDYIHTLIAQLPPERRKIYEMSREEQLSNREIAEKMNLSENTIESQLTKATKFLRSNIIEHYNTSVSLLFYVLLVK